MVGIWVEQACRRQLGAELDSHFWGRLGDNNVVCNVALERRCCMCALEWATQRARTKARQRVCGTTGLHGRLYRRAPTCLPLLPAARPAKRGGDRRRGGAVRRTRPARFLRWCSDEPLVAAALRGGSCWGIICRGGGQLLCTRRSVLHGGRDWPCWRNSRFRHHASPASCQVLQLCQWHASCWPVVKPSGCARL